MSTLVRSEVAGSELPAVSSLIAGLSTGRDTGSREGPPFTILDSTLTLLSVELRATGDEVKTGEEWTGSVGMAVYTELEVNGELYEELMVIMVGIMAGCNSPVGQFTSCNTGRRITS